jgi:GTP cyclohydrolase II
MTTNTTIALQAQANVPTEYGLFKMMAFSHSDTDWMPHLVLISPNTDFSQTVNVRFHSECITGEVFHSKKCECGQQLSAAMQYTHDFGGIIIYLRQEGRNIGIINKLKAYALQEQGFDTVEANLKLGLPADDRDFSVAIDILTQLNIHSVNLITNNPDKLQHVEKSPIHLEGRIPLLIQTQSENEAYMQVKKAYFGHLLEE